MPSITVKDASAVTQTVQTLPSVGQTTMSASLPVAIASDQGAVPVTPAATESFLGSVGTRSTVASSSFTRPADTTAYASGDMVANSTTAGSVSPMSLTVARKSQWTGKILRARLSKSSTGMTNPNFRVHFFKISPTTSAGDNAPAFYPAANAINGLASGYIGACDIVMDQQFSDGASGRGSPLVGSAMIFDTAAASQTIYALIEARGAYAPGNAETFTLTLEVDQD